MENIQFKIDGPIIKSGIPLHLAINALDNFQTIIDKSYLVSYKLNRLSANEREKYFLKVKEFRQNSLTTIFDIVMQGTQLVLPLFASIGPKEIWDYTKETYKFLRLIFDAIKNDKKPTFEIKDNNETVVKIGDEVHNYYGPVFQIGQLVVPNYQSLTHLLSENKITEISAGKTNNETPDILMTPKDKNIFDISTKIEKETVKITCEIFDFNKYKNVGKLSIKQEGQAVPPGDYRFTIYGEQDHIEYIYSMLKPEVTVYCLIEMKEDPFGIQKVHKLHITGVGS